MALVFVYGTLLSPGMDRKCGNPCFMGEAILPQHELVISNGYPAVRPGSGEVHGEVYDVTEQDVARLDIYEGYPHFYLKKEAEVIIGDESKIATVYYQPEKIINITKKIPSGRFRNE